MIRKYKFPPYKVSRQGVLVPRTCVALPYFYITFLHYRRHHNHHHCRCRRYVVCLTTGSQALPKRVLHTVRSSAFSFNVQYFLISMSSSSRLRLLFHLSVPSVFPSISRFRKHFLHMMWPIHLAFLYFTVCRIFLPWLYVIFLHFLRDRSNCSSSFFSSTIFQNFLGIPDLLSEVSKLRLRKKLYSRCNTSLVSSLNLSPICWWKSLLVECCRGNPGFNFTFTSCLIFSVLLFKERGKTWEYSSQIFILA